MISPHWTTKAMIPYQFYRFISIKNYPNLKRLASKEGKTHAIYKYYTSNILSHPRNWKKPSKNYSKTIPWGVGNCLIKLGKSGPPTLPRQVKVDNNQ